MINEKYQLCLFITHLVCKLYGLRLPVSTDPIAIGSAHAIRLLVCSIFLFYHLQIIFFSWFITHRSRLCRLLHRLPHHLPVLLFIFSLGSWRFFRFFAFLDVSLPQKTVFSISRLLIQKFDVQSKFWTPTFSRFVIHAFATWRRLFEPVC